MKQLLKRTAVAVLTAGAMLAGALTVASPAQAVENPPAVPKNSSAKPKFDPGKAPAVKDAGKVRGATKAKSDVAVAADSYVSLAGPYQYCSNFLYLPVTNTSSVTKYFQLYVYTNGGTETRTFYGSVAANSTAYPYFYGITGNYSASLYVWDGSYYSYDSYYSGNLNCNVTVTMTKSGSYALLTVKNNGNTYASIKTEELAPYNAYGTYTGEHWVYPAAYGGTAYQYYLIGAAGTKYGIIADNSGSTYNAWDFAGTW